MAADYPYCKTVSTGCRKTLGLDNLLTKDSKNISFHYSQYIISLINLSFN